MRVVVDIDRRNKRLARKVARRLYVLTGKVPEVRISPTGRGYQFFVRGLDITFEEALRIRKRCGDDEMHIRFDREALGKPRSVMWSAKRVLSCPRKHRLAKFLGRRLEARPITYRKLI